MSTHFFERLYFHCLFEIGKNFHGSLGSREIPVTLVGKFSWEGEISWAPSDWQRVREALEEFGFQEPPEFGLQQFHEPEIPPSPDTEKKQQSALDDLLLDVPPRGKKRHNEPTAASSKAKRSKTSKSKCCGNAYR